MATYVTPRVAVSTRRRHQYTKSMKSFTITFITVVLLAGFLSPMLRVTLTAFKTPEQTSEPGAPLWPALPRTFTYEGKEYEIYKVPTDEGVRELGLVKKGRNESQFIDPDNPTAELITWTGSWRTLDRAWAWAPAWSNF